MRRSDAFLAVAVVATVVLWNVPYGEYVLYPFRIFATWMHECGHGLAALVAGRDLLHITIEPDTSGVAWHSGASGRLALAFVASAGYMGTSVAGAFLVVLGRRERAARSVLGALGALAIITVVLYVRGVFAMAAVTVLGVTLLAAGLRASPAVASFLVNLLGAQSALNALADIRSLFVLGASRFDGNRGTDAATVADLLLLPYWFWAGLWMVLSVLLLAVALWIGRRRRG